MEYIVEKIGMSRTIATKSTPVTLLKLVEAKVCEIDENKRAIVAYAHTKANNKAIAGQQKKYNLTAEFNKFATLEVANSEVGNLDFTPLNEAKILKVSFNSKGRGYQGVVKRHGFGGVMQQTHGQHNRLRAPGSIGAGSDPSRVFKGMRMAGRMGGKQVTVQNLQVLKVDEEQNLLVVKGAVPGAKNSYVIIRKWN